MPGLTTDVMFMEGPFGEFEVDVSVFLLNRNQDDRLC